MSLPGEFGLLACSLAYRTGMIESGFFKAGVAITALSLLCETIWMTLLHRVIDRGKELFSCY